MVTTNTRRRRWAILAVLCVSVLLVTVDNTIVNVALPSMALRLHASTGTLQWVVDAYSLVFAGLLLVGGNMADRLGRRQVLQAGMAAFVATSLGAAVSASSGQLIAARAAMGVAAALVYPSTLALLGNVFTESRERATAIGIWAGVSGLAVAVGPLTGGVLLDHFGWNSVFYFTVALGTIALILNRAMLPESADPSPGRFDPFGAVLSVTAMTALVDTVIEAPTRGWTSTTTLACFAASLAVVAGFIAWESHRTDPLLDVSLFTNARFSAAATAIALAFFGLFGFIFLITLYFQTIRGYSPLHAGIATVPFAAITGAMSPVAIVLTRRFGTKWIVASGLAIMSAGFVDATTITTTSGYGGRIIISMALMAAGLALTAGPASEAIMGAVPAAKSGAGSAVNDTTRELGGALGVAVIGSVFSSRYAPHVAAGLARLGLHGPVVITARGSLTAGLDSAAHLPVALRAPVIDAVRHAFIAGMSAGSVAAAAAAALAALAAVICLPARATSEETDSQTPAATPAPVSAQAASTAATPARW